MVTLDQEFWGGRGDRYTYIHIILANCKTVFTVRHPLGPGELSLRAGRDLVWVAVWFGCPADALRLIGTMYVDTQPPPCRFIHRFSFILLILWPSSWRIIGVPALGNHTGALRHCPPDSVSVDAGRSRTRAGSLLPGAHVPH